MDDMDGMDGSARMGGLGWVDVLVVVGLALVAAGCWGLGGWPWAALVVGAVLAVLGLVGAVRGMVRPGEVEEDEGG